MNLRIAVVCMFMLLVGCGDGSGNAANDQDASSDGDSDTDSDADGDADSDVDADADGDTDADGGGDAGGDGGVQPFRVLFIGNSYTASNSLADLFQQVVTSAGSFQVDVQAITGGGLWLEDHLNNSATVQTMTDGTWDYVVLQEQSYLALVQYQTFYDAIVSLTNSAQWAGGGGCLFSNLGSRSRALFVQRGSFGDGSRYHAGRPGFSLRHRRPGYRRHRCTGR